jgi:DNA-binding PadR family transcriptional regulator
MRDEMTPRPMGYATLAVLQALADGHRYGFDIVDHTGLATGTVYPALSSLEGRGYAESAWEDEDVAHADRRPPRKYYRVTREGRVALREAMVRLRELGLRTAVAERKPAT